MIKLDHYVEVINVENVVKDVTASVLINRGMIQGSWEDSGVDTSSSVFGRYDGVQFVDFRLMKKVKIFALSRSVIRVQIDVWIRGIGIVVAVEMALCAVR